MPVRIGEPAGIAALETEIVNLFKARYLARIMRCSTRHFSATEY